MIIVVLLALIFIIYMLIPTYVKPRVYDELITEEEREHIMKVARDKLKTSTVEEGVNRRIDNKVRVSETAFLCPKDDPIVERVMRRCLKKCDRPLKNCEKLQVVRYKPGGFYIPHNDAFEGENKRKYTFLIALNDDYEGGETDFPTLNKKYKLQAGDVLKFNNLDNYGLITDKSIHGGIPVKNGEKWICNVWVHTHPYGL
jgi:prolyl 4-hydroxylase